MKIAVCFAGFLRSFPAMIGNWNYRLREYDVDYYIHAPTTYYTPPDEKTYDINTPQIVDIPFIQECIGPRLKGLNLFSYDSNVFKEKCILYNIPEYNGFQQYTYRILSYHYNIQQVVKMYQSSNIHYDYVLITRSDLNLYTDFNFHILDRNKINYPVFHGLTLQGQLKNGVAGVVGTPYAFNDQMFVGKSEQMGIFNSIYDVIPSYYSEGVMINSETLLGVHCLRHNIPFGTNDFIKYDILRFAKQ